MASETVFLYILCLPSDHSCDLQIPTPRFNHGEAPFKAKVWYESDRAATHAFVESVVRYAAVHGAKSWVQGKKLQIRARILTCQDAVGYHHLTLRESEVEEGMNRGTNGSVDAGRVSEGPHGLNKSDDSSEDEGVEGGLGEHEVNRQLMVADRVISGGVASFTDTLIDEYLRCCEKGISSERPTHWGIFLNSLPKQCRQLPDPKIPFRPVSFLLDNTVDVEKGVEIEMKETSRPRSDEGEGIEIRHMDDSVEDEAYDESLPLRRFVSLHGPLDARDDLHTFSHTLCAICALEVATLAFASERNILVIIQFLNLLIRYFFKVKGEFGLPFSTRTTQGVACKETEGDDGFSVYTNRNPSFFVIQTLIQVLLWGSFAAAFLLNVYVFYDYVGLRKLHKESSEELFKVISADHVPWIPRFWGATVATTIIYLLAIQYYADAKCSFW